MPPQKTPMDIYVFNVMVQFYYYFIQDFAFIMAPITKLLWKTKVFDWTPKCQIWAWMIPTTIKPTIERFALSQINKNKKK